MLLFDQLSLTSLHARYLESKQSWHFSYPENYNLSSCLTLTLYDFTVQEFVWIKSWDNLLFIT